MSTSAAVQRATIKEAARLAGVSVASVSRALNGKPGISEETRRRILAICEQLDYKPSASARQLISGRDATVGILLGKHDMPITPYFALMLTHLQHEFSARGLVSEIIPYEQTARAAEKVSAAIVLELVENDPRIKLLKTQKLPHVCIGMQDSGSWVAPDDFNGIRQITQLLLKDGRKHLLFVAYNGDDIGTHMRVQGYRSAMAAARLEEQLIQIEDARQPSLQAYRRLMREQELLKSVDGIICQSDEIALGAVQALEDLGFEVPGDIAVTGFDDLPELAQALTTVRQDMQAVARQALSLLDEARRGLPSRGVVLPVEIKRRTSA